MIALLVYFVIACVIMWGVKYIVPMEPPMNKVYHVACVLVALGFFLRALQVFGILGPWPLKR